MGNLARVAQVLAPMVRAVETLSGQTRGPMLRAPDLRPVN
jgi:hypothetical protein